MLKIGSSSDLIDSFLLQQCGNRECDSSPESEKSACNKCKAVWYCNRECQKADWHDHKAKCIPHPLPKISWLSRPMPNNFCAVEECLERLLEEELGFGCATCEKVNYCSRACLEKDQTSHEQICPELASFPSLAPEVQAANEMVLIEKPGIRKELHLLSNQSKAGAISVQESWIQEWHYRFRLLVIDTIFDNLADPSDLETLSEETVLYNQACKLYEIRARNEYLLVSEDVTYDPPFIKAQLISVLEEILILEKHDIMIGNTEDRELFIEGVKRRIQELKASMESESSASAAAATS